MNATNTGTYEITRYLDGVRAALADWRRPSWTTCPTTLPRWRPRPDSR